MRTRGGPPVDAGAFAKLRRILPARLAAARDEPAVRPLPEEVSFKLTNRCDLRCTHCYQWGEDGHHRSLPRVDQTADLPLQIVDKVLTATRPVGSNLYLWGGEPLVYRHWDGLTELLGAEQRMTTLCTNGTLLARRLPSLRALSSRLEVSVSIDGVREVHDGLRGEGAFDRTLEGMRALTSAREAGRFDGELTVACVLSDAAIDELPSFVRWLEAEGVGAVYLGLPWHISTDTATAMDGYYATHFPRRIAPSTTSWRSFTHRLDPTRVDLLCGQLRQISSESRRIKLRYNPELDDAEIAEFVGGGARPAQGKTRCLSLGTRLDVFPDGQAVSCKFFPEMTMGSLSSASLEQVWHGDAYRQMRETIARCGLMPVCAKCNLLYTRGA